MEEEINERILYCLGSATLPVQEDLKGEQDVTLVVKGNVAKIEDKYNYDGTKDRVFKVKLINVEEIRIEKQV